MTTQFFHSKLGHIKLRQLDDSNHPETPLILLASFEADAFLGTITVQEFTSADGPMYDYAYNFKPAVELNLRDNTNGLKLLLMVAGSMKIQVNASKKYELSENKLCLFRSTDYLLSLPGNVKLHYLLFDIDPLMLRMGWPNFTEGVYDNTPFMRLHLSEILKPPIPLGFPVDWLSLQLANLLFQLRFMMDRNQQGTKKEPYLDLALAIDAFIQQNFTQKYTFKTMAKALGSNENTIQDAYKLHFPTTMNRRKIDLRLKFAMEELLRTDKPISEISMECGYDSEPTFRETFSVETGLAPNAWRKNFKL